VPKKKTASERGKLAELHEFLGSMLLILVTIDLSSSVCTKTSITRKIIKLGKAHVRNHLDSNLT